MSFLFHVSIPCDATFLAPMRELTERVVEYAGYNRSDANDIADTIMAGAEEAIRQSGRRATPIDLHFQTDDERFEVTLTYADRALGDGETAGSLSAFVCGREGELNVCRMARNLPTAPSS